MFWLKKARPITMIILLAFICTWGTSLAIASDIKNLRNQQDVIKSKIKDIKSGINQVDNKKKNVVSELKVIEKDLQLAYQQLQSAKEQLDQTRMKLNNTRKELNEAEKEVDKHQDDLNVRMRAMYMSGPIEYIEVLLDSSSFADFVTRLDMIKCVVDADKSLLKQLQSKKDLVAKKKAQLEDQQRQISRQYSSINQKKTVIASRKGDRKRLLAKLENEKREYERQQNKLQQDAKRLANMIWQIQSQNNRAYIGSGAFQWPVPSSTRVTSDYGWRPHPIFKTRRFHNGIDIGAPTGSPVIAVDDGQVIYAGNYGGYGYTVIVDHGGGISSQYSHLSRILVSKGQSVKKGHRIGLVGSTGWSTGPHLHFTVLKNGQSANPWNWLR